ncbi:MAG: hypothetical protein JSV84_07355 [Gemmatimonadota bacterium]|nr:MAG: hypothetical protein JSV84_07355 [Gemmatimonadota bacterium]
MMKISLEFMYQNGRLSDVLLLRIPFGFTGSILYSATTPDTDWIVVSNNSRASQAALHRLVFSQRET